MYDRDLQDVRRKFDKYSAERESMLHEKNTFQSEFIELEDQIQVGEGVFWKMFRGFGKEVLVERYL